MEILYSTFLLSGYECLWLVLFGNSGIQKEETPISYANTSERITAIGLVVPLFRNLCATGWKF